MYTREHELTCPVPRILLYTFKVAKRRYDVEWTLPEIIEGTACVHQEKRSSIHSVRKSLARYLTSTSVYVDANWCIDAGMCLNSHANGHLRPHKYTRVEHMPPTWLRCIKPNKAKLDNKFRSENMSFNALAVLLQLRWFLWRARVCSPCSDVNFWHMHFGCVCACARRHAFIMRMRQHVRNMISVCMHAWIGIPACSRRSPTKSKAIYFAWRMRWATKWRWTAICTQLRLSDNWPFCWFQDPVTKFLSPYQLAPPT